jgi:transketolase
LYSPAEGLQRGAYILADIGDHDPEIILMASGSEVDLIIKAGERLAAEGKNVRMVSFPSWELFRRQEKSYQELVLNPKIKARLAIEAGVAQGWREWVGDMGVIISIDRFGASAPAGRIYKEFGLSIDEVIRKSEELLRKVG